MRHLNPPGIPDDTPISVSPSANGDQQSQSLERLVNAIDVSPSMEAADWPPTRFDAAAGAAAALIERKRSIAPDDEVGIVSYDQRASVIQRPVQVATDHDRLIRALHRMRIGSGTSISAALRASRRLLFPAKYQGWLDRILTETIGNSDRQIQHRVLRIVLLTDGHHNSGPCPKPIARALKRAGVCIDCVGIGGSPSDVDENLLRKIASSYPDGSKRYRWIGESEKLVQHFQTLAGRITRS